MTHEFGRILVAIKDPGAPTQPGLSKAAQLAEGCGAELALFHAVPAPVYLGELVGTVPTELGPSDWGTRNASEAVLAPLARPLRRRGLVVSTSVRWDHPVDEAILEEAKRIEADLIVAEAHPRGHHLAVLRHLTDWDLLRRSPVPVLLIKSPAPYHRPSVLAALDPDRSFDKPPSLDAEILEVASAVRDALGGALHAVHAYIPVPPSAVTDGTSPGALAELVQARGTRAARDLAGAVRGAAIPPENQHVVGRHVPDAIEEVAAQCRSSIIVLGQVNRSGLKHVLIGNTAERLLDQLGCDILVVKAPAFPQVQPRHRMSAHSVESIVIPGV
jgi:universal stress protein E